MTQNDGKWPIEWLSESDFQTFAGAPRQWFADQGKRRGLEFFLAHDDEGVIWGKIEDGQLKLSSEVFTEVEVELLALTLQQARLFGEAGELLVWRGEGQQWHGRYLADASISEEDRLDDEPHRLWGEATESKDGFTLMREGVQGLLHAPPIKLTRGEGAILKVRHYLDYDEQGQVYIALSRLVAVEKRGKKTNDD